MIHAGAFDQARFVADHHPFIREKQKSYSGGIAGSWGRTNDRNADLSFEQDADDIALLLKI